MTTPTVAYSHRAGNCKLRHSATIKPCEHVDGQAEVMLTAAAQKTLHGRREEALPHTAPDAWTKAKQQLAHIELDFKSSQRKKAPSVVDIIMSWCTCTDSESLDKMAWHDMHDLVPVDHRTGKQVE